MKTPFRTNGFTTAHWPMWVIGWNLSVAGGLELARRYGQWDREGYWRHKP